MSVVTAKLLLDLHLVIHYLGQLNNSKGVVSKQENNSKMMVRFDP